MVLTGGALIPHGAMMMDRELEGLPEGVPVLYERTMEMVRQIHTLAIDILILVTPHGMCLEDDIGAYLNETARGDAEWNGHWSDIKAEVKLDRECTRDLMAAWKADGVRVRGVNGRAANGANLCWAEVLPLWMFKKWGYHQKIVILSMPHSRLKSGMAVEPAHVPNLQLAGEKLAEYCHLGMWRKKRVFFAVSGDLAHTHPTTCTNPLFLPDPRWKLPTAPEAAAEFDRRFEEWALDSKRGISLADRCMDLQETALSCGLGGCLLLESAMYLQEKLEVPYLGNILVNKTPTYFTMMSCLFGQYLYPTCQ